MDLRVTRQSMLSFKRFSAFITSIVVGFVVNVQDVTRENTLTFIRFSTLVTFKIAGITMQDEVLFENKFTSESSSTFVAFNIAFIVNLHMTSKNTVCLKRLFALLAFEVVRTGVDWQMASEKLFGLKFFTAGLTLEVAQFTVNL